MHQPTEGTTGTEMRERKLKSVLRPDTVKKYEDLASGFEEFCIVFWHSHPDEPKVFGEEVFAIFQDQVLKSTTTDPNRMHLIRSAIKMVQTAERRLLGPNGEEWADTYATKRIVDAFVRAKAEEVSELSTRMAFVIDMVVVAEEAIRAAGHPQGWIEVLWCAFGALLRRNEIFKVKVGDWNPETYNLWILHRKADTPAAVSAKGYIGADVLVIHPRAREYLTAICKGRGPEELIFLKNPHNFDGMINFLRFLHEKHKWHPSLVWDGAHTLRHGGAVWLRQQKLPESHLLLARGMNAKTFDHYSRTNEERAARLAANKAAAAERRGTPAKANEVSEDEEAPPAPTTKLVEPPTGPRIRKAGLTRSQFIAAVREEAKKNQDLRNQATERPAGEADADEGQPVDDDEEDGPADEEEDLDALLGELSKRVARGGPMTRAMAADQMKLSEIMESRKRPRSSTPETQACTTF